MRAISYLYFAILLIIISCSTTSTEIVTPVEDPNPIPAKPEKERLTTCITLDDLTPQLRSSTEDAFTLYRDQIKFKKYGKAKQLWKQAFYTAPGANGRVTYHFEDGIKIYNHLFNEATGEVVKAGLVDTVMSIYDKRIECFGDDGTLVGRKAFDSYYQYRNFRDIEETFSMFKEVVDRKGEEADYFIVNPFSRLLYDNVLDKSISNEEASKYAYKIFDIIDFGKKNCKDKYCDAWEVIEEYSPNLLSGLEGIRGFYQCDYYMDKFLGQFEEDPSDCDNISEVYLKMVWAYCDKEDARFVRLKEAKEKECYLAPPPPGPLKIAGEFLNEGKFQEAIDSYNIYVNEESDPTKKANILLRISKIYYAHIKNFPAARKYALLAADHRSNWGEPYMLIGKLYASSGPLCGPGRGWDSQIVTWPAIDKFNYAKSVDPSMAVEANEWIRKYSQYMPKKEDIFFRQLKEGSSFKVPCWIQETTRVRTAD